MRAAGAHEVSEAEAPQLHAMVAELAAAAGLPTPRVYVSPAPQPNAMAAVLTGVMGTGGAPWFLYAIGAVAAGGQYQQQHRRSYGGGGHPGC